MPQPRDLNDLIHRFVDDRDGLEEHEYVLLAEAVKESPDLAVQLRDQLQIDDALSQRLAIDRRHFDAQVQQRIADHLRGENELNEQADELRSLALARLEVAPAGPPTNWSTTFAWGTALVLLMAIGAGLWFWQQSQQAAVLATVAEVGGEVIVKRHPHGNDVTADVGQSLQQDDGLIVPEGGSITLTWSDGTRVLLGGATQASLPKTTAGKRLAIDLGDVAASVAAQPDGRPMIFVTPHAEAIVRGTELYLHVQPNNTRLEVVEGKVELVEHETQDVQLVESLQSAMATVGVKVVRDTIRWPTSRQGLVYLFSAGRPTPLLRTGSLLSSGSLNPREDGAARNSVGEIELSGGWLEDSLAGARVAEQVRPTNAMSLELVLAPAEPSDDQPRTILAFVGSEQGNWSLTQSGNRLQLVVGGKQPVEIATIDEFGKLTHLAITYQGDQLRHQLHVLLDGNLVRELSWENFLPTGEPRLVLGGEDPSQRWRGRIAGLAIYDRKLAKEEIGQNLAGVTAE